MVRVAHRDEARSDEGAAARRPVRLRAQADRGPLLDWLGELLGGALKEGEGVLEIARVERRAVRPQKAP